eukprot:365145-Chlamydomonas_euryale.AAC.12
MVRLLTRAVLSSPCVLLDEHLRPVLAKGASQGHKSIRKHSTRAKALLREEDERSTNAVASAAMPLLNITSGGKS